MLEELKPWQALEKKYMRQGTLFTPLFFIFFFSLFSFFFFHLHSFLIRLRLSPEDIGARKVHSCSLLPKLGWLSSLPFGSPIRVPQLLPRQAFCIYYYIGSSCHHHQLTLALSHTPASRRLFLPIPIDRINIRLGCFCLAGTTFPSICHCLSGYWALPNVVRTCSIHTYNYGYLDDLGYLVV